MSNYYAGRVQTVVFENDAQSFYVVKMVLDGRKGKNASVTVRGNVPGLEVREGSWFGFEAKWQNHQTYGRQLVISRAPVVKSWDAQTTVKMLQGHGVGSRVCEALLAHFGEGLPDALSDSERLQEVPSVSEFTAHYLVSRWQAVRSMFQSLKFLSDLNLPKRKIERIYTRFGDEAEQVLSENPWALVEIDGITFDQADEVAMRLGLDLKCAGRIRGAVLHTCKVRRGMGHLYLNSGEIVQGVHQYAPDTERQRIAETLKGLHDESLLVLDNQTRPQTTAIYEPWFHEVERESARLLAERMEHASFEDDDDFAEYLEKLSSVGPETKKVAEAGSRGLGDVAQAAITEWSSHGEIRLSEAQLEGAVNALVEPVSIVTGLPGTGKCVVPTTLVSGPWGARPIGDFLPTGLAPDQDQTLSLDIDTSRGIEKTAYIYNGGVAPTVRITTQSGYTLEGTPEHPIRIVQEGDFVWKKMGDLGVGDVPVIVRGSFHSSGSGGAELPPLTEGDYREFRYRSPRRMSEALARVLGYLISEGTVTSASHWAVTNHDPRVRNDVRRWCQDLFGYEVRDHYDKRVGGLVGVRLNSVQLIRWFRALGVGAATSFTKTVPHVILAGSEGERRGFLSALFEGDGTVHAERFSVEYGTRSEKLARGIQYLLLTLGIVCSFREEQREGASWYRLSMYGQDYDRFRERVGCEFKVLPERTTKTNTNRHLIYNAESLIEALMAQTRPRKGTDYDRFYRYGKGKNGNERHPSREHLEQLLGYAKRSTPVTERLRALMREDFFYDPITTIESGVSQVVDFGAPESHEFLSNGFISHNTTLLRIVVKVLQDAGVPFLLVAPTGIAAKRITAVTGAEASTIHRAFGARGARSEDGRESTYAGIVGDAVSTVDADGSDEYWSFSTMRPHPARVVVVDESSMMDQHLLFRLLSCTVSSCRLVFVGDAAQLPSVGPGNVLRDLVDSERFPVVNLREIFRQDEASDIVIAAHAINGGTVPSFKDGSRDFTFVEVRDEAQVLEMVVGTVEKLYARRTNFQVLSPRHKGTLGVTNLNLRIRELLNPKTPGLREMRLGSETVREGDRVMVSKNNYRYEIFNGDVGKVTRLDERSKSVSVKIHGPPVMQVEMPFRDAPEHLRLAYCVTIHKSQGQEYDVILMPWVGGFHHQLQRNLIYTAITRARKKVILVGHPEALEKAVRNSKIDTRNTLFPDRLRAFLGRFSRTP